MSEPVSKEWLRWQGFGEVGASVPDGGYVRHQRTASAARELLLARDRIAKLEATIEWQRVDNLRLLRIFAEERDIAKHALRDHLRSPEGLRGW